MVPITQQEMEALANRAVGAGQIQLGSILSSIAVMIEQNDPEVLHELAHHCIDHVVAGRQTHGRLMVEGSTPMLVRRDRSVMSVMLPPDGVEEEGLGNVEMNQKVSVKLPDGKFVNGNIFKINEAASNGESKPRYEVMLPSDTGPIVVEVRKVYVPR